MITERELLGLARDVEVARKLVERQTLVVHPSKAHLRRALTLLTSIEERLWDGVIVPDPPMGEESEVPNA